MDDYAGAVDDRLQSRQREVFQSQTKAGNNFVVFGNQFAFAQRLQFRANGRHDERAGQGAIDYRFEQRVDAGDGAQFVFVVLRLGH